MTDVINYLENSSLAASVISLISLGFMGYLVRAIIKGVGDLASGKAELEKQIATAERINEVEQVNYLQAKLYKNAVVGSNLDITVKNQVLADWAEIEAAHNKYLAGINVEGAPVINAAPQTVNPLTSTIVATGTALLAKEATNILEALQDKIDNA